MGDAEAFGSKVVVEFLDGLPHFVFSGYYVFLRVELGSKKFYFFVGGFRREHFWDDTEVVERGPMYPNAWIFVWRWRGRLSGASPSSVLPRLTNRL